MYKNKKFILTKKQSIIFEIIELVVLFFLILYYIYNKKNILTVAYLIPFFQHIKQITYIYRIHGGTYMDYIVFFYFLLILLYSLSISDKLSITVSLLGIIIHIITITTDKTLGPAISYKEIKNYLFY